MATATETRDERIEGQLQELPPRPGVYLLRGRDESVLYVGKAKSLRARVRSYFRGGDARKTLFDLVDRVERIEVIVTQTEVEAFHLEQNLIRRHRPPFNVRLRDDKSYPYIAVTVDDDFPRVMFTRERHRRGVVYFGPYASAKKVRETLDVLNRVFPYRPCEGPQPGRHSGIPCLDYHIERCLAPCVGYVSNEDYRAIIERVIEFLSGETRPVIRELEGKMQGAAEKQDFEQAARYRNRLFSVRHLAERQAADKRAIGTVDVIGIAAEGATAAVQIFPLRGGRLVDRHTFYLENAAGEELPALLEAFCVEYYGSAPAVPPLIVIPAAAGAMTGLEQYLSDLRGSQVEVRAAQRGEKRRLAELAQQNAELALRSDAAQKERKRLRRIEALEELRENLNLESLPIRIECFDISTIQGESAVGSMVVFQDAAPKKAHYRKFGIKGVEGQDDFAMMAEVLRRRFMRYLEERDASPDRHRKFSYPPNLLVIDGGRGQLNAVLQVLADLGLQEISAVALAKRFEEIYVPNRDDPVQIQRGSEALFLLQHLRDEAHRFAVTYHRTLRDKRTTASALDRVPGVGDRRKKLLLRKFGSVRRILQASEEELAQVVPASVARRVHETLRDPAGTGSDEGSRWRKR